MKKEFILSFVEEDGTLNIGGENKGFSALELIGLLNLKLDDIVRQVNDSTKFERVVKTDDATMSIVDKAPEPAKKGTWYSSYDPLRCETVLTCSICGCEVRYKGMLTRYPDKCDLCKSTMEVQP